MTHSLAEIKDLNYDHHRRMAENHEYLRARGELTDNVAQNRTCLAELLGTVQRFGVEHPRVLELGASGGGDFDVVMSTLSATSVSGIDVHEPSVATAIKRKLAVRVGFVEELPYQDGWFDVVISRHVMEHVSDVDLALAQITRVSRSGAIVAAVTPAYQPDPEPAHIQQLTLEQWMDAYKRNGFEVLEAYSVTHACEESHIVARTP